jgi:acetoin utilization deacetylase AcuC-like enzyme
MVDLADAMCGGRLVVVHEGGYAEAYVPFCGLAILEALAGKRSPVIDPELDFFIAQQPDERMLDFHRILISEMRNVLEL